MILTKEQIASHKEAAFLLEQIKNDAFLFIRKQLLDEKVITEKDVQEFILHAMKENNLITDGDKPIVAVNEHTAIPHYAITSETNTVIKRDNLILIDMWARKPAGIYADITWMGYTGEIPAEHKKHFSLLVKARDAVIAYLEKELQKGIYPTGYELDCVAREVIKEEQLADYFIHNTGHSIDEQVHGSSTNLRGYTEKDERKVHKNLLFSVEPGLYFKDKTGYRTEIDAYISQEGEVIITGPLQQEILKLLP